MGETKPHYRPDVDGLRAIAVLSVVGFHAFRSALPGGFVGVDIFFVISGLLISTILYHDVQAAELGSVLGRFYSRRIRRIFPALVLLLSVAVLAGFALLDPGVYAELGRSMVGTAGFFLNFQLAQSAGYFAPNSLTRPLLHLWSLSVEEQFYLLWPVVLWFAARRRWRFMPVVCVCGAASLALCLWAQGPDGPAGAYYLPTLRLWELLAGALAALVLPKLQAVGHPRAALISNGLGFAGIFLIGSSFWWINSEAYYPGTVTLLPVVGSVCLVLSPGSWIARRVLSLPWLVGCGLISYPLYLWHWPVLCFGQFCVPRFDAIAPRLAAVAVAVGLAWATYRWVETPFRRPGNLGRKVALLASGMGILAFIGAAVYLTHGFLNRYPPVVQRLYQVQGDQQMEAWRKDRYFLLGASVASGFEKNPQELQSGKPMLLLWGDSHAASLYPGFVATYGDRFTIVQRTIANGPPFIEPRLADARITVLNQETLDLAVRIKPAVVVLAARWAELGWKPVAATIAALHRSGITHIVLVGPLPEWTPWLPTQLFQSMRRSHADRIPERLATGARPDIPALDAEMKRYAAEAGVSYDSPLSILRNDEGYLVRVGDSAEDLVTWDYGHLTVAGSKYLVSHFDRL